MRSNRPLTSMSELIGKKQVFVGSSTEGKHLAENVILELEKEGLSPLAWYEFFKNDRAPVHELEHLTLQVDGAVLVATSDDNVIIRGRHLRQARDNVLFEYGLFAGKLGRGKCSLLVPDEADFQIPSDFLGVACFERYPVDKPKILPPAPSMELGTPAKTQHEAISAVAKSLAAALAKPPREDSVQSRGRRLLALLGWIRDESFRLVQDWDDEHGREIVSDRIVAVSAFIREDINKLNLRREYDTVERVMLQAAKQFPKNVAVDLCGKMKRWLLPLLSGDLPPNRTVFDGLQASILRREPPPPSRDVLLGLLRDVLLWLLRFMEGPNWFKESEVWFQESRWHHYRGYVWPYAPYEPLPRQFDRPKYCQSNVLLWAAGVAEAATVFEQMANPANVLLPLKQWSERFLPKLNESIVAFERRLHEEIFGRL
jgi:predicted nucleotide-binding protein